MKKRKTVPRPVPVLANATTIKNDNGLFQFYKGDFFTLFVTHPPDILLHHRLKQRYLDWVQPLHLLYQDNNFVFEIYLEREAVDDYSDFTGVTELATLIPFWSLGMEQAVRVFFNTTLKGPLADRFTYARVIDLLVQLSHHIQQLYEITIDNAAIRQAEKAKQIILEDISVYETVETVARKVGVSEADLQLAFKHRFGMTVGKFSKDERMKFAHNILETTDDILLSVALSVGYNDPGNFSVAFKNYYGYSPGFIQRKKKLFNSQQDGFVSE